MPRVFPAVMAGLRSGHAMKTATAGIAVVFSAVMAGLRSGFQKLIPEVFAAQGLPGRDGRAP